MFMVTESIKKAYGGGSVVENTFVGKDALKQESEWKEQLKVLKAGERYEEALAVALAFLERNESDTEVMTDAADIYFMAGDYGQARGWIDRILLIAPQHLAGRVLLARICILGNRAPDGLAILERMLEWNEEIPTELQGKMKYTLEYFRCLEGADDTIALYPRVKAFVKGGFRANEAGIHSAVSDCPDFAAAESIKRGIMEKEIPLPEKIAMFNSFAGAYYGRGRLAEAELLLVSALEIDEHDQDTLRNLAVLVADCGDFAGAMEYAAQLPKADFCLLHLLREKVAHQ